METTCSKCRNPLEPHRLGKQRYCLRCHAAYMRARRPKHRDLSPEQRRRANTRSYSNVLKRCGILKKEPCACGSPDSEMRHQDYENPWKIKWMCKQCRIAEMRLA